MATGPKRGKRRPRPKKSKQKNSLLVQSLGAVIAFVLVIFSFSVVAAFRQNRGPRI